MPELDAELLLISREQLDEMVSRLAAAVSSLVAPTEKPCLLQPQITFPLVLSLNPIQVVKQNANRKVLIFSNTNATGTVNLLPGQGVNATNHGILLPSVGGYIAYYYPLHIGVLTAEWTGQASTNSTITVIEFLDPCVIEGAEQEEKTIGRVAAPSNSRGGTGPSTGQNQ